MGEVTAAVVAGALSPAEGLRVIATRSRLMSRLSGQGAMALLELDAGAAEELIADYPEVTLAVYASPRQSVIAGPPEQVDAVIAVVDAQGRLARRIEVDVASHHPTIDPILPELRTALAGLTPQPPSIPVITTTHDETVSGGTAFDADYWAANLRNPVRFSQAVATAGADHATFVEVSPHPLLTYAISESLESVRPRGDVHVAATVNRDHDETLTFHAQLAAVRPPSEERRSLLAAQIGSRTSHRRRGCIRGTGSRIDRLAGRSPVLTRLLGVHVEMPSGRDHVWQADVGTEVIPWLEDHKVHGQPIMPAAGFAEMVLAAGSEALGLPVEAITVNRLEVEQMLPLDSRTPVTTQLVRSADNSIRVEIHSRSAGGNWCRHAVAGVEVAQQDAPSRAAGFAR